MSPVQSSLARPRHARDGGVCCVVLFAVRDGQPSWATAGPARPCAALRRNRPDTQPLRQRGAPAPAGLILPRLCYTTDVSMAVFVPAARAASPLSAALSTLTANSLTSQRRRRRWRVAALTFSCSRDFCCLAFRLAAAARRCSRGRALLRTPLPPRSLAHRRGRRTDVRAGAQRHLRRAPPISTEKQFSSRHPPPRPLKLFFFIPGVHISPASHPRRGAGPLGSPVTCAALMPL